MTKSIHSQAWSNAVIQPTPLPRMPHSDTTAHRTGGNQKKLAQPLPPAPNPKSTQSQAQSEPSSTATPNTHPNQSHIKPLYEVHTEGPLTYFNYYFEDVVASAASQQPSSAPSKATVGLVGAGVVAVTVASGLVISEALKQPDAPPSNKPSNTVKRSTTNLPRPTTTSPERLGAPQSSPTTQPAKPQPNQKSSIQSSPQQQQYSLPTETIAVPETITLNPLTPLTTSKDKPAITDRKLPAPIGSNLSSIIARQRAIEQSRSRSIAQPETLKATTSSTDSVATRALSAPDQQNKTAQPQLTAPVSTTESPNPSTDVTSNQPNNVQPQPELESQAKTNPDTTAMPPAEDANELIRLLFERNKVAMNDRPATLNADNAKSVNQTAPTAANTQGIKDYLNLGQKANSNSVTLMPLSQRAATEVTNTDQVGQFTVRQVSSQDYQKEWVASNKAVEDPAIALAYPAYGFIDYQRQLIVVLQSPLENPSAQSKQSVVPKS